MTCVVEVELPLEASLATLGDYGQQSELTDSNAGFYSSAGSETSCQKLAKQY